MGSLRIRAIDISASSFLKGLGPDAFVDRLSEKLAESVARASTGESHVAFSHYICSSTLDIAFSGGWLEPGQLTRKIHDASGLQCSYSHSMQCATWGFLVRQHLVLKPRIRHILMSIVDANPLAIRFWEDNVDWGRTGHRVTMLHLEIPESAGFDGSSSERSDDAIIVARCDPAVVLYDYAREMQRAIARHPDHTVALPYFSERMRKGLRRSLGDCAYLPDLYEDLGHLCGSDPWMSIAMDVMGQGAGSKRYLASSIASQGYCCFLSATVDEYSKISVEGHA